VAVRSLCPACNRLLDWSKQAQERLAEANRQLRNAAISYEKDIFAHALARSRSALDQCEEIRRIFREHASEAHGLLSPR